jgi:protein ImuA
MQASKADIIAQLKKDILPLQGFKSLLNGSEVDIGLGPIKNAFPNRQFPLGAIHEFIYHDAEQSAPTAGFISGILSALMQKGGACVWISSSRTVFPPALKSFGIEPDKIIFIDLQKEKDILWAMEEALKCESLAAVVGEIPALSFTASRRLQLAVEQSRVTGFILRRNPRILNTTACVTRWNISSLSSAPVNDMPGIGFPRWNVELLKIRNGQPGKWTIEWRAGRFRHITKDAVVATVEQLQKKAG